MKPNSQAALISFAAYYGMASGQCPFLSASKFMGSAAASLCPFASKQQSAASEQQSQNACCDTNQAASVMPHSQASPTGVDVQQKATCPLGFGSSSGPRLSSLHCPLCRSLLFDTHVTKGCSHKFCRDCIARFQDCPVCGMDITETVPDTKTQGVYVSIHRVGLRVCSAVLLV